MKIKTSKATALQLNWLVANCEGLIVENLGRYGVAVVEVKEMYNPSADWSQGGPIIERERIGIEFDDCDEIWFATASSGDGQQYLTISGPTSLIAAMRCFVASKLGGVVDVPEELT